MKSLAVLTANLFGSLALAALPLLAAPATASPLCVSGNLSEFIALGTGGCQIEDKIFSNFAYSGTGAGGAAAIPAFGINVAILDTPKDPGIQFSAPWSVGPGQILDSLIQFVVTVSPGGQAIDDISAAMTGFGHEPNGAVTVVEATSVGNLGLRDDGGTVAFATLTFAPTMGPISVATDIAVAGNSGVAAVSSVTNRFSEVPEPSTLFLLGSSLFALGAMGCLRPKR